MADGPLNTKAGLSVADFKAGIAEMNRSMRVLSSEFKASAAALGDWSKDASGLESRIGYLNKAIDLQQQKVNSLKALYDDQVSKTGENSAAAQEYAIKINKATEELNGMQRELGEDQSALSDMQSGTDEAGNSTQELGDQAKETSSGLDKLKSAASGAWQVMKVGAGIVMGLVGMVAALGASIGGLVLSTASASAELQDLSTKTGISTERLQELSYVGDQVGTSQESIVSSLTRLTRSMADASTQTGDFAAKQAEANAKVQDAQAAYEKAVGTYGAGSEKASAALEKLQAAQQAVADLASGDMAAAFQQLGVSVTDANGNLRDNEAVFADVLDALGNVSNETERDALAMQILGKNAQELNPLIKAGSAELANLSQQAHDVGAVVSGEDVQAFADFQDTVDSLKAGLQGTIATLAGAFLPGFQAVFSQAGGYVRQFSDIVRGSNGDVGQIAQGMTGLIQQIITDIAAQAPSLMQSGLTILQTLIQSIITALPTMLPVAVQILMSLINFIVQNLPMIITAGMTLLITLVQGLAQALPTLIPAIVSAMVLIVTTLLQNMPLLIDAALQLIMGLANGLIAALPILIPAIPQIIQAIVTTLLTALPQIAQTAGELIATLAAGIVAALPGILAAALQIANTLFDALSPAALMGELLSIGESIVQGVWQGIQNASSWFYSQISGFFAGLVDAAKAALGIQSPSKLFSDEIGKQIPPGVGQGIKNAMPALDSEMDSAMRGLARNVDIGVNASATAGSAGSKGSVINLGPINVDARGAKDPAAVGKAVGDGVVKQLRAVGVI